jgi:8-oxo-dGTP pyrophosphatase MutT (NUDIX family)
MQKQQPDEEVYRGQFIHVLARTLPESSGGTRRFEVVEHPGAVAIVALREEVSGTVPGPYVALVHQERPAIEKKTWEIPAGIIEANERDAPQRAAERELREETGYVADHWRLLVREYPSPGFSTETITLYLATHLHPAPGVPAEGRPEDATEIGSVRWFPLKDALDACRRGEIEDGKTLLALTLVQNLLLSQPHSTGDAAMPRDPSNMPFARSAPFREDDAPPPGKPAESKDGASTPAKPAETRLDATLKAENMLLEEFNYASLTAYQAFEDRARIFNFYLLLVGILASALGALYQLGGSLSVYVHPMGIILLVLAGILGIVFFLQLIRLRQAYRDSLITMNVIKEFYIKQFEVEMPVLSRAFRWRLGTIPPGERLGSLTFWVSYTVAFLGSLCFAGAAFLGYQSWVSAQKVSTAGWEPYLVGGLAGLFVLALTILYYWRALNKHEEKKILAKEERKIGAAHP